MTIQPSKQVVLSGMRPTGDLHIGHFEGVLRNWVELQETHECFYFVADWHALTTELDTKKIEQYSIDMVADWIAFGVDPEESTLFVQSYVPQHAELNLALERLVNIGVVERLPTFRGYLEHLTAERKIRDSQGQLLEGDQRLDAVAKAEVSLGFLAYPVLQAADILLYNATHVPVGEDQLPHIELTKEIARRFNRTYEEVFVIPEALLGEAKRIRGTDGRKMSKSYNNDIGPRFTEEQIMQQVKKTITTRPTRTDKGNPFECPVYDLHHIYNVENEVAIQQSCLNAHIGCYDCKMELPPKISFAYEEYRDHRATITDDFVKDVLCEGNKKAKQVAHKTMEKVRSSMHMHYLKEI